MLKFFIMKKQILPILTQVNDAWFYLDYKFEYQVYYYRMNYRHHVVRENQCLSYSYTNCSDAILGANPVSSFFS